jgi:hypothetical protein
MSRRSAPPASLQVTDDEVVLRLDRLEDLFGAPALPGFDGSADLVSGIERLVAKLQAQRDPTRRRPVVVVADRPVTETLDGELRAAVATYCDVRMDHVDDRRAALRHDGLRALWLGLPLLLLTVLVTAAVVHSGLPGFWRAFLAGVLLVLAWVALWYPLDTLLWYGRPWHHERRVLGHLRGALVVRGDEP